MRALIVEAEPSTDSGGPPAGTNEQHVAVALLRALVDPVATLEEIVSAAAGSDVQAVVWFGSIARGQAIAASDIDLAVTAPNGWNDRVEMADAVPDGDRRAAQSRAGVSEADRGDLASAEDNLAILSACDWPVAYRRHIENQIRAGNTTLP